MKRVIVIDMAGEGCDHEAVRTEAYPVERQKEALHAPAEGLLLETVSEELSFETRAYYKSLFDEYFRR